MNTLLTETMASGVIITLLAGALIFVSAPFIRNPVPGRGTKPPTKTGTISSKM